MLTFRAKSIVASLKVSNVLLAASFADELLLQAIVPQRTDPVSLAATLGAINEGLGVKMVVELLDKGGLFHLPTSDRG